VQRAQGDLAAALTNYRASLAIRERLAKADPGNAGWQRGASIRQIGNWVRYGMPGPSPSVKRRKSVD
jgi:hypothetical protein